MLFTCQALVPAESSSEDESPNRHRTFRTVVGDADAPNDIEYFDILCLLVFCVASASSSANRAIAPPKQGRATDEIDVNPRTMFTNYKCD